MKYIRKYILYFYWTMLLVHILFHLFYLPYVAFSKLLLVPSLIVYLFTRKQFERVGGVNLFYLIAMVFAFIGDMLLLIINDLLFLPGMVSYMINLVLMGCFFLQVQPVSLKRVGRPLLVIAVLSVIAYYIYDFLGESLREFRLPVVIYMVIVGTVAALSINTTYHSLYNRMAWLCFFGGMIVFMLSNAILVLNRFHFLNHYLYVGVMVTYGLAQFLFARGAAVVGGKSRIILA